jgi:hypothetical protein
VSFFRTISKSPRRLILQTFNRPFVHQALGGLHGSYDVQKQRPGEISLNPPIKSTDNTHGNVVTLRPLFDMGLSCPYQ